MNSAPDHQGDHQGGHPVPAHAWRWLLPSVLGMLLTAGLGVWQLSRAHHKLQMQHDTETRAALPALRQADWGRTPEQVSGQYFRLTAVRGRWRPQYTLYLRNRVWVDEHEQAHTGFYVITPLELASGEVVLVQRGWVARNIEHMDQLPTINTPAGLIEVVGRLAPAPSHLMSFVGKESGAIRQNVDLSAFGEETGLHMLPFSIQQTVPAGPPDGLVRQWPRPAFDIAKHYGYAFQWFAMSVLIAFLYVWFHFIAPRRHAHAQP